MRPNILLIILDGVRFSNTSLANHTRNTTPELESFANEATVYTQARAPGNWSLPSHTSIFTGLQVPEHNVVVQYDKLRSGCSIWERLDNEWNYETGLFSQNEFITSDQFGLAHGFNTIVGPVNPRDYPYEDAYEPNIFNNKSRGIVDNIEFVLQNDHKLRSFINYSAYIAQNISSQIEDLTPLIPRLPIRPSYRSPAQIHINEFLQWENQLQEPWAACLNFMDANMLHFPWPEPEHWMDKTQRRIVRELDNLRWDFHSGRQPWWKIQALEPRYDDGIRQLDAKFGRLIRALKSRDQLENTYIVVTSDHGDTLGKQSRVRPQTRLASHSAGIHESLLRVPLVVSSVGQKSKRIVREPVSLTQFPEAVEQVIRDSDVRSCFQTDEPVIAAAYHDELFEYLVSAGEWHIQEYSEEIDLSKFSGAARAVYKSQENNIQKYITWGDDQTTININELTEGNMQGVDGIEKVESIFNQYQERNVKLTYEELSSIDKSTIDHLRELGYTQL